MFVVEQGWLNADEVVEGDRIRNADLRELAVLSVDVDPRPQIVHNLEIADAHTYFAGEFEAWGHNGYGAYVIKYIKGKPYVGKGCPKRAQRSAKDHLASGDDLDSITYYFSPKSDRDSFILEDELICDLGGIGNLQNRIESPGKKLRGR